MSPSMSILQDALYLSQACPLSTHLIWILLSLSVFFFYYLFIYCDLFLSTHRRCSGSLLRLITLINTFSRTPLEEGCRSDLKPTTHNNVHHFSSLISESTWDISETFRIVSVHWMFARYMLCSSTLWHRIIFSEYICLQTGRSRFSETLVLSCQTTRCYWQ